MDYCFKATRRENSIEESGFAVLSKSEAAVYGRTAALRQQRPFPHRMLWNGSSQLLVQQLKEVAYSFERLRIAIADIDHAIAFSL